jgi:zinc/manganese transport system substrate-binding protein
MTGQFLSRLGFAAAILVALSSAANAADKVKAVASFSILGDMVRHVGGNRVEVVTLVGPNADAHVFNPTPADVKALAAADVFFVNGLGFEGWIERLEKSSGFRGEVVVASKGVTPLTMREEEGHRYDPHAWQDLANGKIYVANIRDALVGADPDGESIYEANAAKYLDAIDAEEAAVKAALGALPEARRKIITSHDAFAYFGKA